MNVFLHVRCAVCGLDSKQPNAATLLVQDALVTGTLWFACPNGHVSQRPLSQDTIRELAHAYSLDVHDWTELDPDIAADLETMAHTILDPRLAAVAVDEAIDRILEEAEA